MLTPQPPNITLPALNQTMPGFYGEFGHGGNVEVRFIQSVITSDFLSKIKLIEQISGSERWNIKDLFQRNVDHDRVNQEILPYLRDPNRVQFIPPLTLVLLPMGEGNNVIDSLEVVEKQEESVDGYSYNTYGDDEYFKFYDSAQGHHQFASVKWNDSKVNLVAVDGQHRLTAFKTWMDDPDKTDADRLESMSIPVVILGFSRYSDHFNSASLLDVVRNTFVYINSKSQKINESRRILLDDESATCVCTQEVVQYAHQNDQKEFEEIDTNKIPLMMIDWRAEEKEGRPQPLASSIFSVRDVHDWMHEFILGDPDNKSDVNKKTIPRLLLNQEIPSFNQTNFPLVHKDSDTLRNRFKEHLLPSVVYVLENINPYSDYIKELRKLERQSIEQADSVGRHAFKWISFGKSSASILNREAIEAEYNRLSLRFGSTKEDCIPKLLTRDIGIRSVWSAFSSLKDELDNFYELTQDWKDFSEWFVDMLNQVINDGWFVSYEELLEDGSKNIEFLTHIAYGPSGNVINYKPSAVNNGLGALLAMLIMKKNGEQDKLTYVWNNGKKDSISIPIKSGVKAIIKANMNTTFTGTRSDFESELKFRTEEKLAQNIREFEEFLGIE